MRYPEKVEKAIIIKREIQRLNFDNMVQQLYSAAGSFPDKRTGKNLTYSIEDVAMGAFSVFFTQSPSFLAFQKAMEKTKGKSNAQTMFGMNKIPCDNHIRDILDEVDPSHVFPIFSNIFSGIKKSGILDTFRCINDNILIALDGTQYFSSNTIHCENCSTKKHRNGKITYFHSAITPVVVVPGNEKVISLEPEFVTPQDGHTKQDCENAAAKRWLRQYGPVYKGLKATVLGDDLYSRQPLCEAILKEGLNFILVCKPGSLF